MRNKWRFKYLDRTCIREKQVYYTGETQCMVCREIQRRGFEVHNDKPVFTPLYNGARGQYVGFVCIHCCFESFREEFPDINTRKDIVYLDLDILKKYAFLYTQWRKDKLCVEQFILEKNELQTYIPIEFLQAVERLADLDIEYGNKIHLKENWSGWWRGLTGQEVSGFVAFLKSSISNRKSPMDIFVYEKSSRRFPEYVRTAEEVYRDIIVNRMGSV
jgi:hypothetical protein